MNKKEEKDFQNFTQMRSVGLGIFEIWFQTLGYAVKAFIVFIVFVLGVSVMVAALIIGVNDLRYFMIAILILPAIAIVMRIKYNLGVTRKMVKELELRRIEEEINLLSKYTMAMEDADTISDFNSYVTAYNLARKIIVSRYQNAFYELSRRRSFASLYVKKNSELLRR